MDSQWNPATLPELERLTAPIILRRSKSDILPHLPPKRFAQRVVPMEGKQYKAYASMKKELVAELESGELLVAADPMQRVLRLLQLSCATPLSAEEGQVELTTPSNKAEALIEIAEERGGDPTVVFCASRRVSRLCGQVAAKAGHKVAYLDGHVPAGARAKVIEEFQAGETPLLLATYAVGGTGVTLTAADLTVRLQRPWSLTLDAQAVDRTHRVGAEHASVMYLDVVSAGSIEPKVVQALEEKATVLHSVVKDPDVLAEWLEAP